MLSKEDSFLQAWLKISSTVSNERIVTGMLFTEAQVCNIIYYQNIENPDKKLSATDLCRATHMHKSLMNRTINKLESKGIIERHQDKKDKRKIILDMGENFEEFINVHKDTMKFVNKISENIGEESLIKATEAFNEVADIVDKLFYK